MKRRLAAAGASGLAVLVSALAAPPGAERCYFAAALAPALLALVVPFGLPVERRLRHDAVLPPAAGAAALLALAGFGVRSPGLLPLLGAAVFLAAWSAFVAGLFRLGARRGAAAGHLVASGAGLFLCATHLLFDPVIAAVQGAGLRRALVEFAVGANPSLIVSAAFWKTDLLMKAFVYARSDIGAYHAHAYPAWGWVALAYAAAGAGGWLLGKRAEPEGE